MPPRVSGGRVRRCRPCGAQRRPAENRASDFEHAEPLRRQSTPVEQHDDRRDRHQRDRAISPVVSLARLVASRNAATDVVTRAPSSTRCDDHSAAATARTRERRRGSR